MKRIVHVCLCSPYTNNWGYQENILPRVQVSQGNQVTVVATCDSFSPERNGNIIQVAMSTYYLEDGVRVIRILPKTNIFKKIEKAFPTFEIYELLNSLNPDILFIHGLGTNGTNKSLVKYIRFAKKHKAVFFVCGDTHLFEEVAPRAKTFKSKLLQFVHDSFRKNLIKYLDVVYAITPACMDYANKYYGIPDNRMKLLPLGYDPNLIHLEKRDIIKENIRKKYGIKDRDFLIVHGGKIEPRRKTIEAIKAVNNINNKKIKLLVFGGIAESLNSEIMNLISNSDNVIYTGYLSQSEYINVFLSADLGLFPGGQSVLWQEAIGCGLPLILGKAKDIDYLNQGGNVVFTDGDSIDSLTTSIKTCINNYSFMRNAARSKAREYFSYKRIANQIIEDATRKNEKNKRS